MTSISDAGWNSDPVHEKVHVYRKARHVFFTYYGKALVRLLERADLVVATRFTIEDRPENAIVVTDADAAIAVLRLNGVTVIVHE